MATRKIGFQDGIEAARRRWNEAVDPGKAWPDKLAGTLGELTRGHNDTIDKLAELEGRLDSIPFPFRASS